MAEFRPLPGGGGRSHRRAACGARGPTHEGGGLKGSSTLILAASGAATPEPPSAETVLLGLPLVERTAMAARRAGFDRVYLLGPEGAPERAVLRGTGVLPFPHQGADAALPPGRIVLLPDRVVADPKWLRSLREAPVQDGRLCRLGSGTIVETSEPEPLARALADHSRLPDILEEWATTLPPGESASCLEPPFELATKRDVAAAEQILLKGLVKPEDGFLTRHISRKISLAVTRRLAATPVTPNAMTFFCLALGLAAAWCFGSPVAESQLTGGLFFLLHSILDGCDGELARLKFKESRLGGVLDFWSDNVVHVAVFSALAYAWSAAVDDDWPLLLGAAAVSGTILSAGFVYLYAMRPRQDGRPLLTTVSPSYRSRLTEVLDAAARRDFIYLVMVFSLFGKAYWFVAAAAVGAPVFFVSMLFVALGNGRPHVSAESPAVS